MNFTIGNDIFHYFKILFRYLYYEVFFAFLWLLQKDKTQLRVIYIFIINSY